MTKYPKVCQRVFETGLHTDMLSNLNAIPEETLASPRATSRASFVHKNVNSLHNVVRNFIAARRALRQKHALDVFQKFRVPNNCCYAASLI